MWIGPVLSHRASRSFMFRASCSPSCLAPKHLLRIYFPSRFGGMGDAQDSVGRVGYSDQYLHKHRYLMHVPGLMCFGLLSSWLWSASCALVSSAVGFGLQEVVMQWACLLWHPTAGATGEWSPYCSSMSCSFLCLAASQRHWTWSQCSQSKEEPLVTW